MKNWKKCMAGFLAAVMMLSTTACGASNGKSGYVIGICQLVEHIALDEATKGFQDALIEEFGDKVTFDVKIAKDGSLEGCREITNQFAADNVDLIMANATGALKAAAASTNVIPIVATSVTDYASALNIRDWTGTTGINVTGTSDLAPIQEQAKMVQELFPEASSVGILFSKNESNSIYQARMMELALADYGIAHKEYIIENVANVEEMARAAASECQVIYLPTDNTMAASVATLKEVFLEQGVPAIAGEEGICEAGVATLSISYYSIGYDAGKMAAQILRDGTNPADMDIQYAKDFTKKYHADNAQALGVSIPDSYEAIK